MDAPPPPTPAPTPLPEAIAAVRAFVAAHAHETFREPSGVLAHPHQVPSGYYQSSLWCWDAVFEGVGSAAYGGAEHFAGSMRCFLDAVDLATGALPGCLTPSGPSPTLYHAKPIIVQGALLAARAVGGDYERFRSARPAMEALLAYWDARRLDARTGLYVWRDQMESGADDLPYSAVPSGHTPGWSEAEHGMRLASPDVQVFVVREHRALAAFARAWARNNAEVAAAAAVAAAAEARASATAAAIDAHLWRWEDEAGGVGYYVAYDTVARAQLVHRTYQVAWPLWEGLARDKARRDAAVRALLAPDLRCGWGVRSTSSADARYSNVNCITPYSNWRGPVWINVNAVLCYALAAAGYRAEAQALADDITRLLADDAAVHGRWHECYHSEVRLQELACPSFLSWNMMGAALSHNIKMGIDPLAL